MISSRWWLFVIIFRFFFVWHVLRGSCTSGSKESLLGAGSPILLLLLLLLLLSCANLVLRLLRNIPFIFSILISGHIILSVAIYVEEFASDRNPSTLLRIPLICSRKWVSLRHLPFIVFVFFLLILG